MKRILAVAVVAIALVSLFTLVRGERRVVYRGGPVVTMDGARRIVEALGVEGDRIAAVGSEDEVLAWADGRAEIVELQGRALLPGFIDAHGHFPGEGIYAALADLNSPPIGEMRSIDDIVARMRTQSAETPAGEWVVGMSYDDSLLAEKRHPTREDLDRISTAHPVALVHISGHLATVNSRALTELGFDAQTPDPEGGVIRRDASGEPDGVLEETAADPVMEMITNQGLWASIAMVREANQRYAASGTTTAQSGYAPATLVQILTWASRLGLIPLRLVIWPGMEDADQMLDGEVELETYDPDWVRIGRIKLVADGSIQGYTGYLGEPYYVPPGDDPDFRGYPRIPPDELRERVLRYHRAGLPMAIHGNGDASIDDILDALEAADAEKPFGDVGTVIIHAQMAREDQLDRMEKVGAIPSFFVLHTYYWGDRHHDIFMGPERAARMSPVRSALDRDLHPTLHADSPVVPMEPLRIVWSAVNRQTTGGRILGEDQRVTVMDALAGVTIDAARQHFEDDRKGSLEVGKFADLVILSESPLDVPEHIDEIEVVETIVGGETIYHRDDP
jgi:predicted amidohydrolase YtcJ